MIDDILLYYPEIRVRLKAGFCSKRIRPTIHGKRIFLKPRGDVQEDDLKLKTKSELGKESIQKKGFCTLK
jgi:hypothetical protein